jgi:hypothetical protein
MSAHDWDELAELTDEERAEVEKAQALRSLLAAIDLALPSGSLVFAPRTVVVSLLVGTLVALLASFRPALRATRVQPIAAVREGAVLPPSRLARRGPVVSAAALAVAAALLGSGLFADGLAIRLRLLTLGVGVLLFLGVALVAQRLVRPLAAVWARQAAVRARPPNRNPQTVDRHPQTVWIPPTSSRCGRRAARSPRRARTAGRTPVPQWHRVSSLPHPDVMNHRSSDLTSHRSIIPEHWPRRCCPASLKGDLLGSGAAWAGCSGLGGRGCPGRSEPLALPIVCTSARRRL